MVPFGLTSEQFSSRFLKSLEKKSPSFIDSLKKLFSVSIPDTVKSAQVQIFIGDDCMETPSAWIYYEGGDKKIDHSDPSIFAGKSLELLSGDYSIPDFDEEYYLDEDFSAGNLIANLTKQWLAECWWKAGGWDYPISVEVWVHDDHGDGMPIQLSKSC